MRELLILVPCDEEQKRKLEQNFQKDYHITYACDDEKEIQKEKVMRSEIIIGEPEMEWIQNAPMLKWVQMTWAGTDKYTNYPGFPENVLLTNATGAFGVVISEYVIGAVLTMYRRFPQYWKNMEKHVWKDMGSERCICGKRVLILGTGNIGTETAKRFKAFGAVVSGIRRTRKRAEHFDEIHVMDELNEELQKADIVVGCLPNNAKTAGIMNDERFGTMKKDALFVNVGRGNLVEPGALERTLRKGHLLGAVLDVTKTEPLPFENSLWDMENVMITPHIAGPSFGHDKATEDKIWEICRENLKRYLRNEKLQNLILS